MSCRSYSLFIVKFCFMYHEFINNTFILLQIQNPCDCELVFFLYSHYNGVDFYIIWSSKLYKSNFKIHVLLDHHQYLGEHCLYRAIFVLIIFDLINYKFSGFCCPFYYYNYWILISMIKIMTKYEGSLITCKWEKEIILSYISQNHIEHVWNRILKRTFMIN